MISLPPPRRQRLETLHRLSQSRECHGARRFGVKLNDFSGSAVDESRDIARHPFRRRFDRVSSQVGVARRGLDLRVAEQLADHGQAFAESHGTRRERMAQVVDAHVHEPGREVKTLLLRRSEALVVGRLAVEPTLESTDKVCGRTALCAGPRPYRRALAEALPRRLQIGSPRTRLLAADDPRIVVSALKPGEHLECRGAEVDETGAGLRLGQPEASSLEVHVVPLQRHDLVEPAPREDQKPDGRDRERILYGLLLGQRDGLA
jgi:hypothetical protein